jgi:O-antigen/teichoic acid export membrane protein
VKGQSTNAVSERAEDNESGIVSHPPDVLSSPEAQGLVIRGGMLRVGGYLAAVALAFASIPLLTRYLGVDDFGRYVTVLSLIAIAGLVADAGLTVVGMREYVTRDPPGRTRLMSNLVGLRAVIAAIGVAGATAFALLAGYGAAMVAGTVLAGVGLVLVVIQQTYTVPLQSDLRLGIVSTLDLARHALTVLGIVVLIVAGAGLIAFLAIPIPVGLAVAVVTAFAIRGRRSPVRPAFQSDEWRYLMREALPVAIASTIGAFFYRSAIIVMSLIATPDETGYFSASFRIIEAIIIVAGLITASAFPIVARAAHDDRARLVYSMQRLFDVAVILGAWTAICVVIGGEAAMRIVGGPEFDPAASVLQVQGIALAWSFLVAVWATGLWALRAQRALAWANLVGVVLAIGLTAALIPSYGAIGAAVAMTIVEGLLAAMYAFALMRDRPELRPRLAVVPKTLVAAAGGLAVWLTPLPDIVEVVGATVVFYALLVVLRGIPDDLMAALRERWRTDPA